MRVGAGGAPVLGGSGNGGGLLWIPIQIGREEGGEWVEWGLGFGCSSG